MEQPHILSPIPPKRMNKERKIQYYSEVIEKLKVEISTQEKRIEKAKSVGADKSGSKWNKAYLELVDDLDHNKKRLESWQTSLDKLMIENTESLAGKVFGV